MTAEDTADALRRATDALQAGDLDRVRTWSQWAYVHATEAWQAERAAKWQAADAARVTP